MDIQFEKQYNPELDCCLLLYRRYLDGSPRMVVEDSLNKLSANRGIPIEQLRAIAAPSLELERHIVENLSVPEERLRFFFPARTEENGVVSLGFLDLRRWGVRFRELDAETAEGHKRRLLHLISAVEPELLAQVTDVSGLIMLLEQKRCTDHTLRLCLGVYLNPALYQEQFDEILDQAVALYREKMDILPAPDRCTFDAFQKKWAEEGDNLRILNSSLSGQGSVLFIPSPFVIYARLSVTNEIPQPMQWILGGIWDDKIAELMGKYNYPAAKLAIKLKVLSDQKRLEILGEMCEEPRTVDYLSKRFSMSPALLSYHLEQFLREGFINREFVGKSYRYSLNYPHLQMLLQNLKHHLKIPD